MAQKMTVWALEAIPEVQTGDDLATLIVDAVAADEEPLVDGDILVVTSKIVSKAEGRVVQVADRDLHGQVDSAGRPLLVTQPCIADELAAAGDLVKGKLSGCPVAVVRGLGRLVGGLDLPGAASIVRDADKDMFRLGADEAHRAGHEEGYAAARAAEQERVDADSGLQGIR